MMKDDADRFNPGPSRSDLLAERDRLRAVNKELVEVLEVLETAARRYAHGLDQSSAYILGLTGKARAALAKAREGGG